MYLERQMMDDFDIRASIRDDLHEIEEIYRNAFPDEDLLPLIRDLQAYPNEVISLVGTAGSLLIAHVAFTKGSIDECRRNVALLGPLAVTPAWQQKGAGSLFVRYGLQRLQQHAINRVFVLGDPAYYSRFGFAREVNIAPPFPLPSQWRDAWQSLRLGDADEPAGGTLCLPDPWLRKDLWSP